MLKLLKLLEAILTELQKLATQGKEVMTLREAARYLDISEQKLYQMTSDRQIPFSKPCGRLFLSKTNMDAWALGSPVMTAAEIRSEYTAGRSLKKGGKRY